MSDPSDYGDRIADMYDSLYPPTRDVDMAVDFLAGLAGTKTVLELGVGTGRVAIPLAAAGVSVVGVDASAAMLRVLGSKPGGRAVGTILGDFSSADLGGPHGVAFVAFNTFFSLLDQVSQVSCFQNVASSLLDGGAFVMEAFVPDLGRFDRGQRTSLAGLEHGRVIVDVSEHDPSTQRVSSAHVVMTDEGIRVFPVEIRYAWPSELDLMARIAGLELEQRWGSWDGAPFGPTSNRHVSVWRRRS